MTSGAQPLPRDLTSLDPGQCPFRYRRSAMTELHAPDAPDVTLSESRAVTVTCWVLVSFFHAATAGLVVFLGSIVLFEEDDFGPASRSVASTIVLCVVVMLVCDLLMPWLVTLRMQEWDRRSPAVLHMCVAMYGMVSMLGYMFVMDPAGGRREVLTVALPAVLMPIGYLLAWRAFQIGAKSVGRPARDVSDWSAFDHLLGRRRRP